MAASGDLSAARSRVTTIVRADEKTGHLVRSVVVKPVLKSFVKPSAISVSAQEPEPAVEPLSAPPADSAQLIQMIDRIAAEQGVEDSLVHSVIRAESNYDSRAVSPKGALGMMQLIPSTAKRFGVANAFDARENIVGGVKYLRFLLDYYRNDYVRAIAAYNAGEAAVDKYNGVPPYSETRNYVYRVAQNLKTARAHRTPATVTAEASAPATESETYRRIETSIGSDGRIYYRTP